jgi:hypothetical protein
MSRFDASGINMVCVTGAGFLHPSNSSIRAASTEFLAALMCPKIYKLLVREFGHDNVSE